MDETVTHATEHPELRRAIGPWMLFFFVIGDIVGAGIYALVGEVGAVVGGDIWTALLFSFILAIFTAGSYAELVTKYPRAGGAATYVNNAFRTPFVSFILFFSSRRRHTRYWRDWSSDVCSSDLRACPCNLASPGRGRRRSLPERRHPCGACPGSGAASPPDHGPGLARPR